MISLRKFLIKNTSAEPKQSRKETYIQIAVVVFSVLFIWVGSGIAASHLHMFEEDAGVKIYQARITETGDISTIEYTLGDSETITTQRLPFAAKILTGELKGTHIVGIQTNDPLYGITLDLVKTGDKVMIFDASEVAGESEWVLHGYVRTDPLIFLGILFMALLLLFGRGKGLRTIIAISFTVLSIFTILVPAILSGYNIYIAALIVSLFIVACTLLLVNGCNLKSLAAGIGCLGGLATSGVLIYIMDIFIRLTGYLDEESYFLTQLNTENPLDLKAIIFAAIVIGAMGAALDVGISISASLSEMYEDDGAAKTSSIINSGFNIGKDILGTMCNTLLLAYIGSTLTTILLLFVYNNSLLELLNREMIIVEILQSLVGCIGLLLTIPLTAVVYAVIHTKTHSASRRIEDGISAGDDAQE